jgi:hypothetical protein
MLVKNGIPGSASALAYRQELEYLYARRSAIDSLIESLEEYDRCRETGTEGSERRGRVQGAPRTRAFAPRSC